MNFFISDLSAERFKELLFHPFTSLSVAETYNSSSQHCACQIEHKSALKFGNSAKHELAEARVLCERVLNASFFHDTGLKQD